VSNRTVSEIGEHALISRITARLATPSWVLVGPGDDAAVIRPERGALDVLTTDAQVEGIHFDRRFVPPDAIGHRALAVNLSDLAAMGAAPRAALLSLVLPDDMEVRFIDAVVAGLLTLADRHRVAVIGGNITRSPQAGVGQAAGPMMIDVTAIGSVKPRRILTRSGARPGDEVFVTGTIGGAAVGLHSLRGRAGGPEGPPLPLQRIGGPEGPPLPLGRTGGPEGPPLPLQGGTGGPDGPPLRSFDTVEADLQVRLNENEQKYVRPEPRVRAGLLLGRNRAASACIDLSDGLADGLRQLAGASGTGIAIDEEAIPLADGVAEFYRDRGTDALCAALAGGDDYELLFTARPSWRGRLKAVRSQAGNLPITKIGVVTRETRLIVRTTSGDRDLPAGFEHFRRST
jgi:thiamine-monophosphate kinase